MRYLFLIPVLALAACNVESDSANDQMTLEYNQELLEDTAADVGNTVEDVAQGVGNVAESAGGAIQNEVGDVDVDVDVNRNDGNEAN